MKYERSLDISGIPEMTELIHDGGKKHIDAMPTTQR